MLNSVLTKRKKHSALLALKPTELMMYAYYLWYVLANRLKPSTYNTHIVYLHVLTTVVGPGVCCTQLPQQAHEQT